MNTGNVIRRERDQNEHEEYENNHKSIRNLGQMEQMEVKAEKIVNANCVCKCAHRQMCACMNEYMSIPNCV